MESQNLTIDQLTDEMHRWKGFVLELELIPVEEIGCSDKRCSHQIPTGCSWIWASILKSRRILRKGTCYQVGSGTRVNVWNDP